MKRVGWAENISWKGVGGGRISHENKVGGGYPMKRGVGEGYSMKRGGLAEDIQ